MAETILVGCKLPHGIYLDLRDGAGNISARVKLPGNAHYTLPNPDRKFKNPETVHGDTFTQVDKAHWDAWIKLHGDHPALRSGAIYSAAKKEEAIGKAKEHEFEDVGFNKIDPNKQGITKLDGNSKPAGI